MYLGFDTSNYTTSVALFDGENIMQQRKLLEVKRGEKGLRQSDAVFQHTVNMQKLLELIKSDFDSAVFVEAAAVSAKPRSAAGSYMPCFLVGVNTAKAVSTFTGSPLFETSHQTGHILAALYDVKRLDLINDKFIAFHLSGGTTEALLVTPSEEDIFDVKIIGQSLDLKAGQAVDRTGVMLGLNFPCGKELDRLSLTSTMHYKHKATLRGFDISLSGIENKAKDMVNKDCLPEDIANFVLTYLAQSIDSMLKVLCDEYGNLPVVFSGGVSGNTIIRNTIKDKYKAYFASPEYSCDNAAGIAIYAYLKDRKNRQ